MKTTAQGFLATNISAGSRIRLNLGVLSDVASSDRIYRAFGNPNIPTSQRKCPHMEFHGTKISTRRTTRVNSQTVLPDVSRRPDKNISTKRRIPPKFLSGAPDDVWFDLTTQANPKFKNPNGAKNIVFHGMFKSRDPIAAIFVGNGAPFWPSLWKCWNFGISG